jgi:preprotein translocase subunit YajC
MVIYGFLGPLIVVGIIGILYYIFHENKKRKKEHFG